MRRLLAGAIALGLALIGPASLSACALVFSSATECATPVAESHCDKMDMGTPSGATAGAQTGSCCTTSQAPLPESRNEVSKVSFHEELVATAGPVSGPVVVGNTGFPDDLEEIASPPLRSFLCTFLN